jgi:hypothetical protein
MRPAGAARKPELDHAIAWVRRVALIRRPKASTRLRAAALDAWSAH